VFVLEKSSLPSLMVWARQGAYHRVNVSGASHYGRLLALAICIRLDGKRLASDKHSSFLQTFVNYDQKSFITLGPDNVNTKH
jgi:hypothetical protein